jgi:YspA, cpYpsA-related SLOG family
MRVLVCGGRKFADRDMLYEHLDVMHRAVTFSVVIHGDAPGADTLAKEWAKSRGVKHLPFPAKWTEYGDAAGSIRNTQMLVEGVPDKVVAFPGGSGTANMVEQARKAGVRVCIYGEGEKTGSLFG